MHIYTLNIYIYIYIYLGLCFVSHSLVCAQVFGRPVVCTSDWQTIECVCMCSIHGWDAQLHVVCGCSYISHLTRHVRSLVFMSHTFVV